MRTFQSLWSGTRRLTAIQQHTFLQRFPALTTLRSLYIPTISGLLQARPTGRFRGREAALQVVDIVALRPEMQLCYVAIGDKCFEIVPDVNPRSDLQQHDADDDDDDGDDGGNDDGDDDDDNDGHFVGPAAMDAAHATHNGVDWGGDASEDDGDEDEDGAGLPQSLAHGLGGGASTASFASAAPAAAATDEQEDHQHHHEGWNGSEEASDDSDDEAASLSSKGAGGARMGLTEIVWYDERIDIFKARHGRIRV